MKPLPIFLLLVSLTRGQMTCTPDPQHPSCACTLDDGTRIDLRSVGNQGGLPAFTVIDSSYQYTYNPCYSFTSGSCENVAVCQTDSGGTGRSVAVQAGVTYSSDGTNVVMNYGGGLGDRSAVVTLKCGTGGSTLSYDGEQTRLEYSFTLTSPCACPNQCGSGNGGGGSSGGSDPGVVGIVLLSLLFVGFVVYFIVGMIIMKVKFKRTGCDIIPNKQFWASLPFLLKDGVLFTVSPCITVYKQSKGYSKV
ncbi:uncharacterized protein [Dysidea avara]|uniref:uncharacterized protein n=1 Tax=Dysidea avara TaxID=196820 RepID=UPI00332B731E